MPMDARAGRVGVGLHPLMARRRAGDLDRRLGRDAAVELAVAARPATRRLTLADLDHGAAMRRHLDRRRGLASSCAKLIVLAVLLADTREHQFLVGVFVVGDEQAMVGRAVDRDEADEVGVVAELAAPAVSAVWLGGSKSGASAKIGSPQRSSTLAS